MNENERIFGKNFKKKLTLDSINCVENVNDNKRQKAEKRNNFIMKIGFYQIVGKIISSNPINN